MLQTGWPRQIASAPGRTAAEHPRPRTEPLPWMSRDRMNLHGEDAPNGGDVRVAALLSGYSL